MAELSDASQSEALRPTRVHVEAGRAWLLDSILPAPAGTRIGLTNPDEQVDVSVMVKSRGSSQDFQKTLKDVVEHRHKPLDDAEFEKRFGIDPGSGRRVEKFAAENGLAVAQTDKGSGRILLHGTVKDVCRAFNVNLEDYRDKDKVSRLYKGVISVPAELAGDVLGIFGLENQEKAMAQVHRFPKEDFKPRATFAHMPDEIADAYHFPKESMGEGQSVGILEFGGGLAEADNDRYYRDHQHRKPDIQLVGVDGATNSPGDSADDEVALDSQIIGIVAPGARQQIVFAPNTDQGFIDAISRATFPEKGETQNSAISISWGAPESTWAPQTVEIMDLAFKRAAMKGISVFAASGDNGALDRSKDGRYNADFPASDPYVTGTGGTRLYIDGNREIAWNESYGSGPGNSGGGISEIFAVPEFQKDLPLPANANHTCRPGRGVPDIAGNAAMNSGYFIRCHGYETVTGGTSAVAPLYAALTMRINGALGHPVGYLNPFLYKQGASAGSSGSSVFRDIVEGTNYGYNAGTGWDAVTGWGSLNGEAFQEQLRRAE
jgi:kumamolisin